MTTPASGGSVRSSAPGVSGFGAVLLDIRLISLYASAFAVLLFFSHVFIMAVGDGNSDALRKILVVTGGLLFTSLSFRYPSHALMGLFVLWTALPTSWLPSLTINASIGYVSVFTALLLVVFAGRQIALIVDKRSLGWTGVEMFLLCFLGWCLVGMFISTDPAKVFVSTLQFASASLIVFRIARSCVVSPRWLRAASWTIAAVGALVAALAVYESYFLGSPLLLHFPTSRLPKHLFPYGLESIVPMRASSTLGNPLALGTFFNMVLPFSLQFFFESRGKINKLLAFGIVTTIILGILVTFSRAALAVALFQLLLLAFLLPSSSAKTIRGILLCFMAVFAGVILVPNPIGDMTKYRFSGAAIMSSDLYHRVNSVTSAQNMIIEKPWTGFGLGTTFNEQYSRYRAVGTEPHNTFDNWYLALPAMTGIPGLALFLSALFCLLRDLFSGKVSNQDSPAIFRTSILAAVFGMLANALTMDTFSWDNLCMTFWMFGGLSYAARRSTESDEVR